MVLPLKKLPEKEKTQEDSRIHNFSGRKCKKKIVRRLSVRKGIAVVYIKAFNRLCEKAK